MTERPDLPADGAPVPAAGPAVPDDPWSTDALVDRLLHDDVDALAGSPLAGLVHALRGPATADELAGEPAAVAAFLAAVELGPTGSVTSADHPDRPRSRARRRPAVLSTLLASKFAIAAAAASAVTLGGTAAAAYTGALPDSLQKVASETIGAPQPATEVVAADTTTSEETETPDPSQTPEQTQSSDPTETATDESTTESTTDSTSDSTTGATPEAKGPNASGPAAFGLCTAFLRGGLHNPSSTAYQALVAAANGATATPTQTATDGSTPIETATGTAATDPASAQTTATGDDDAVKAYCEGVLGARASTKASSAAEHGKSGQHGRSGEHSTPEATESTEAAQPEATDQQESQTSSHGRSSSSGGHGNSHGNGSGHRD